MGFRSDSWSADLPRATLSFLLGSLYFWRHREELSLWVEDEFSAFRRNLSRFESVGPFYLPRTESRLRVIPAGFLHSVSRFPVAASTWSAFLLVLGLSSSPSTSSFNAIQIISIVSRPHLLFSNF